MGARLRPRIVLAAVALAAAVAGCGTSSSSSSAAPNTVTIVNFSFSPASASVAVGTTVTWTNQDGSTHTATSDPGGPAGFDTGNITPGHAQTFTFAVAGTYGYHCNIHQYMKATITVTP